MRADPFLVLDLSPECTSVEVARQGTRLLGLIEVQAEGAETWTGFDGQEHPRTPEAVREAVAAGLGVGVVCEYEFVNDIRLHKLKVKNARMRHTESVVCRLDKRTNPVVAAFLEIVEQTSNYHQERAD